MTCGNAHDAGPGKYTVMLECLWIVSNVKNAIGIGDKINTKMNSYRLNVRVGNYIYTVDVWQYVIEYIHEEYPERV
jgi:hypothetical protein